MAGSTKGRIEDYEMRKMLMLFNIDPKAQEYQKFKPWQIRFCEILHYEGDPAKAYQYASKNCPENLEHWYLQRAEFFRPMKIERQQKYFEFFAIKKRELLPIPEDMVIQEAINNLFQKIQSTGSYEQEVKEKYEQDKKAVLRDTEKYHTELFD